VDDFKRSERLAVICGICDAAICVAGAMGPGVALEAFLDSCLEAVGRVAGRYEREIGGRTKGDEN